MNDIIDQNNKTISQNIEIETRNTSDLYQAVEDADFILTKKYQYELNSFPVVPPSNELKEMEITKHLRLLKIESLAYDKKEDNLTRLSNVYNALTAVGGSVILVIDSNGEWIDFYIGTKTIHEKDIHIAYKTLQKSLYGNFPGCSIKNQKSEKINNIINNLFIYKDESSQEENRVITAVNGISSIREVNSLGEKKGFVQGIEKLIDAMRGEIYSVILIADPISQKLIDVIRTGYEQLYTKLVPFTGADITMSVNESKIITDSITKGAAESINQSLTLSQSHAHTSSESSTYTVGVSVPLLDFLDASMNSSYSESKTESDTVTKTKAETKGTTSTESLNIGVSYALSAGESQSLTIKSENKSVKGLIDRVEKQLERLDECGDLGMWNCAAYFIADDEQTSITAASAYQALTRGENSGIEAITLNTWQHKEDGEKLSNNDNYKNLIQYLKKVSHPIFYIGENVPVVTSTSLISSSELTVQAGFPQNSVPGLAVVEYATFGREVITRDNTGATIQLGNIFHMGNEEKMPVEIDINSLTAHTFITGSTGSGKSNTVYNILEKLSKKKINFLVIEPAKGEYKNVFGNRSDVDVSVYGTNPKKTDMIRINPFKFPSDIHVLEHLDRLVEIFNVCWPMYAAMPAILKDSIERAYIKAGWDLRLSENKYNNRLFPNFSDVLYQIRIVLNESDYSADNKGDYIGALVTRLKSLTNGINGMIFTSNDLSEEKLFDENVVIDLSRVGSVETKALIMGLLVMKLQEYRMTSGRQNAKLSHVTVLEEAHNLLKRTSTEQSTEGTNLLGKSVEMLANSIAEMRTYGEGFIIADQSPGMLDMSVIRNTNTKIIMRLPDFSDRELVGKAAGLNDDQIKELSKLQRGIAAVYQNEWINPVLCKIPKFSEPVNEYLKEKIFDFGSNAIEQKLLEIIMNKEIYGKGDKFELKQIFNDVMEGEFNTPMKCAFAEYINTDSKNRHNKLKTFVYEFFNAQNAVKKSENYDKIEDWTKSVIDNIVPSIGDFAEAQIKMIMELVIYEQVERDNSYNNLFCRYVETIKKEDVL